MYFTCIKFTFFHTRFFSTLCAQNQPHSTWFVLRKCLQLKALLPFLVADSGSVPSPGLCQTALSLHCNQLVQGSLFLFYLPRNVCHNLETEDGQKELCIPIKADTQLLCARNPEHGQQEMLSVINLPFPYPTGSTEADLYILNFN